MTELAVTVLSRDEARSLTDEVKQDAERLWRKLVELYDGGAHLSLGYPSWGSYFEAEFGGSQSRAYQVLDAGRVARALGSTIVERPANEAQARELAPLLDQPDRLRETWAEVVELHPEPTAASAYSSSLANASSTTGRSGAGSRRVRFHENDARPLVAFRCGRRLREERYAEVAGEPFGFVRAEPAQVREVKLADEHGVDVVPVAKADDADRRIAVAVYGEQAAALAERVGRVAARHRATTAEQPAVGHVDEWRRMIAAARSTGRPSQRQKSLHPTCPLSL